MSNISKYSRYSTQSSLEIYDLAKHTRIRLHQLNLTLCTSKKNSQCNGQKKHKSKGQMWLIKTLFLYFNVLLSVMLDILVWSFISYSFLLIKTMICKPLHGQQKIQQNESHFKHTFSYINQSLSSQLPKVKCIHKWKFKQRVTQRKV